jgi:tRNA A37 N6-isopentenylltransferase MiaA
MFAQGWVEEVRRLVERYGMEAVKAFPGIGYREIAEGIGMQDQISKFAKFPNSEGKGAKLRGQVHSQVKLGNEESRKAPPLGTAAATLEWKSNIMVATRQYAKRQLTWFAREPSLQQVLLVGRQPFSTVVPTLS